jgi:hypothetical protein
MSVVFFEGFNYTNSDTLKLNPDNWSVNDPSKLTFGSGRTGNEAQLQNRNGSDSLDNNTVLTLENFIDPLVLTSGFAIGFAVNNSIVNRPNNISSDPYSENFIKLYDNNENETLSIDIIRTSGNYGDSLGFGIYQNGSLVDTYDLKSHLGYSWNIPTGGTFTYLSQSSYIDIYIDPINSGHLAINLSAASTNNAQLRNTSDEYYTAISGFNSLGKIKFYSQHNGLSSTMNLDDLYIKGGNNRQESVIGNSVKIYKLTFDNNTSQNDWVSYDNNNFNQYSHINSNDGDASYILSSTSGDVGVYNLSNLPTNSPSGVAGIKISNVARSSDIDTNWQMVNVLSDGTTTVDDGAVHSITSTSYSYKDTFLFENPITSSGWTIGDINNLQIGLKNLGPVT